VYRESCDSTEGIVSVHISSRLGGTYDAATIAEKRLRISRPIEVIDSMFDSAADQLKKRLSEFIQEEKTSIVGLGANPGVHGGPGVLLAAIRRSELKG